MAVSTAVELEVAGRTVRITNPDKVYFPRRGFTKMDVVTYYVSVGDGILRALDQRPTTLERWPSGVFEGAKLSTRQDSTGDAFYQKRIPSRGVPPWIETAEITFPSGRPATELCPADLAHVAWAAQLGTIVFHPWPVRRTHVDEPDELRIDLDPQPGTGFPQAATAATVVHEVLDELGWVGFPKTSGGRGVHVYVRIRPQWTFVQVRRAAIALAREVERRRPDLVTTNWWKEERGERVFVDFNQMARDRTIACAYSLRANLRATASTPVTWEELTQVEPDDFDLASVRDRFAKIGDPHAAIDDVAHDLAPLLEWSERDERDGQGDMPYPPEYPKMPGEPPRVQPSRKNPKNWEDTPS
ncbi:MAG: non-homologous end-joining DNA ligase [Micromonosporaceae bacterium]